MSEQFGLNLELQLEIEKDRRKLAMQMGLISEEQLIELAKITPKTAEDWRKRSTGPRHKLFGNAYFYLLEDVIEFIKIGKKERMNNNVTCRSALIRSI